jgi:hypothetical protein
MVAPHTGPPSTKQGRRVAGDQAQAVNAHAHALTDQAQAVGCHAMPVSAQSMPTQSIITRERVGTTYPPPILSFQASYQYIQYRLYIYTMYILLLYTTTVYY